MLLEEPFQRGALAQNHLFQVDAAAAGLGDHVPFGLGHFLVDLLLLGVGELAGGLVGHQQVVDLVANFVHDDRAGLAAEGILANAGRQVQQPRPPAGQHVLDGDELVVDLHRGLRDDLRFFGQRLGVDFRRSGGLLGGGGCRGGFGRGLRGQTRLAGSGRDGGCRRHRWRPCRPARPEPRRSFRQRRQAAWRPWAAGW